MSYTPYAAYGSAKSLGQAADRLARERERGVDGRNAGKGLKGVWVVKLGVFYE